MHLLMGIIVQRETGLTCIVILHEASVWKCLGMFGEVVVKDYKANLLDGENIMVRLNF